jgi:hypothetical protein
MMSKSQKEIFINDLMNSIKKDLLKNIDKYPESWDGIEIRWLIEEFCNGIVWKGVIDKRSKRYKDYRNEIICNNLI